MYFVLRFGIESHRVWKNLLNQEATLKAESSEVRQKLQDSESTAAVVQSNNNVITKLLKAQEEGRLQGIFVCMHLLWSVLMLMALLRGDSAI